jgi:hypothetical protein
MRKRVGARKQSAQQFCVEIESTEKATGGGTVMRSWPAGRSRNALTESTAAAKSTALVRLRWSAIATKALSSFDPCRGRLLVLA